MRSESWPKVPLKDVLSAPMRNGFSPAESNAWTGIQMLGLGCLTPDGFQPVQLKNAPSSVSGNHPALLRDGDLLVSRANTRELVGLAGTYSSVGAPCIYPDLMIRLRTREDYSTRFLEFTLRSMDVRTQVMRMAQGTSESMVKISASSLGQTRIPFPPISAQRRIVEVLESIEEKIAVEQVALEKEMSLWDEVVNQQLLQHAGHYEATPLQRLSLCGGEYGSNAAAVERNSSLPRYVRITDITDDGTLDPTPEKVVSLPTIRAQPYILNPGDLLIARTGFTTGKSYLYQPEDGLCAYAGYLVRFQINQAKMLPEYAFLWTRANAFKSWVSRNVREVGQRNISAREFGTHRIPVPPLEAQHKLVAAWREARTAAQLRRQEIQQNRVLKRALANDLLSGQVRVDDVA